jgi:hypothetical protein
MSEKGGQRKGNRRENVVGQIASGKNFDRKKNHTAAREIYTCNTQTSRMPTNSWLYISLCTPSTGGREHGTEWEKPRVLG